MNQIMLSLGILLSSFNIHASGTLQMTYESNSGNEGTFKSEIRSNADDTKIEARHESSEWQSLYNKSADGSWSGTIENLNVETTPLTRSGNEIKFSIRFALPDITITMIYDFIGIYSQQNGLQLRSVGHDAKQKVFEDSTLLTVRNKELRHVGTFRDKDSGYKVRTTLALRPITNAHDGFLSITDERNVRIDSWAFLKIQSNGFLDLSNLAEKDPVLLTLLYGIDWWVYLQQ
jgi:hypothetical protein